MEEHHVTSIELITINQNIVVMDDRIAAEVRQLERRGKQYLVEAMPSEVRALVGRGEGLAHCLDR